MLDTTLRGSVLFLTIDRPEVRNAFNDELIAALTSEFKGVSSNVRCIVLSGTGKAFCAGGDLEWMKRASSYSEQENYEDALKLAHLFHSIAVCPVPVIARVHGAAFGGGSGLVAASDIAVASPDARFAFSEVRLGLLPGTISPYVIPKIGAGNARAYFITGEAFSAETALRIGLIHEIAANLDEVIDRKVSAILSSGPNAISASKSLVQNYPLSTEEAALRLAKARSGHEGKEGVAAFLEKRQAFFVEPYVRPSE